MERERRFYDTEIRSIEGDGEDLVIGGLAITFENPTNLGPYIEVISRDAAKDCLPRTDIVCLLNHNSDKPMARESNKTLSITEDEQGVSFKAILNNTSYSKDCYEAVKRADIKSCSFQFSVDEDGEEWSTNSEGIPVRRINRFSGLFDVSPVTFPAYESTNVSTRSKDIADELKRKENAPEPSTPAGDVIGEIDDLKLDIDLAFI